MTPTTPQKTLPQLEDELLQMLYPPPAGPPPNAFDEFFDNELYSPDGGAGSIGSLSLIEQYLNEAPHSQSDKASRKFGVQSLQPWRKGFWSSNKKASSANQAFKPRSHPTYVSPANFEDRNDYFNTDISQSTYNSTYTNATLNVPSANAPNADIRSVLREQTLSPSPMYAQLSTDEEIRDQEVWQERFRNSYIQMPAGDVQAKSTKIRKPNRYDGNEDREPSGYDRRAPTASRRPHAAHITQELESSKRTQPDFEPPYHYPASPAAQYQPTLRFCEAYGQERTHYISDDNFSDPQGFDIQDWSQSTYDPKGVMSSNDWKLAPSFSQDFHYDAGSFEPPTYVQTTSDFGDFFANNGLKISYPSPEEIGCAVSSGPAEEAQYRDVPPLQHNHLSTQYPIIPPPIDDTQRLGNDLRCRKTRSTSTPLSSSQSPCDEELPSRSSRHRSPSRDRSSRRKSISRTGPMRESTPGTSSPKRPTSRSRSQTQSGTRARNRSASAKANKAARNHNSTTAALATFEFDFVNFTLKDSAKLMTDVAPSGSSKTKARRDQEAKDKRKKMNDAAISAVRAAGGNVRELQMRLVS